MSLALQLVTPPSVEPVSLAEARAHLKAASTAEDSLIQDWIVAARSHAESLTWRKFCTQTWDYSLDSFPRCELEIPHGKLQSITSITYVDVNGVTQTLSASDYQVDIKSDPGRIAPAYGLSWPSTRSQQLNAVTVRFVCGYGLAAAVPREIKAAICLIVGHLYEHREEVSDFETFKVPNSAENLLSQFRCGMRI